MHTSISIINTRSRTKVSTSHFSTKQFYNIEISAISTTANRDMKKIDLTHSRYHYSLMQYIEKRAVGKEISRRHLTHLLTQSVLYITPSSCPLNRLSTTNRTNRTVSQPTTIPNRGGFG